MDKNCELIYQAIQKSKKAADQSRLMRETQLSEEEFQIAKNQLIKFQFIQKTPNGYYQLCQERTEIGILKELNGQMFLEWEGNLIPVFKEVKKYSPKEKYVLARIRNYGTSYVDAIIEEPIHQELGELYLDGTEYWIRIHTKSNIKIKVKGNPVLIPGLLVNFDRIEKIEPGLYSAEITKIVGHVKNPNTNFKKLVSPSGIETEFPFSVIQASGKLPKTVYECEKKGRIDLTKENTVTIDGADSKDFDDAVSIQRKENGNWILKVSIADVDYYVKEGSIIDKEAYKRASSVYLMNRVVPMLPHKLSTGICSLNEGVDRLTLTCEMEVNPYGEVLNSKLYESVIHSKKRMKYHEVNAIFEKGIVTAGYEPFLRDLKDMLQLAYLLHCKRKERGSLEFNVPEIQFSFDKEGKPIQIHPRERGVSEHIIEEFMLLANTSVAKKLKEFPVPRRVNPEPNYTELKKAVKVILNCYEEGKLEQNTFSVVRPILEEIEAEPAHFIEPKKLQVLLKSVRKSENGVFLSNLILSAMKRAYYTTKGDMHYALALPDYTHFTSPIRRYSDLMIHRAIKKILLHSEYDYDKIKTLEEQTEEKMKYISWKEKKVQRCERMVDSLKRMEYLKDHIGETFTGYIENVSKHGLQVCFEEVLVGKVPPEYLTDYSFNGLTRSFQNEVDSYEIGNPITIELEEIDFEHQMIKLKPRKRKEKQKEKELQLR